MKTRTITGIVAFLLFLPVLIWSSTIVYPIVMSLLAVIACGEMLNCLGVLKKYNLSVPSFIFSGLLPICVRLVAYHFGDTARLRPMELMTITFLIYVLYIFGVAVLSHKTVSIEEAVMTIVTVTYITFGFCSMVLVRDFKTFDGKWVFLIVFMGAWLTDIFAYFCGRAFGKHKLIPEISPKKTVEGSIGGIICCMLGIVLYGFILSKFTDFHPNYIVLAVSGIVSSTVSQIGDLIMSVIKRRYAIKDYGKILPGHGGILDRFDSVIAVAPALYVVFAISEVIIY